MAERRTGLYRLFNDQERLLYVGIAFDPRSRWKVHAREKSWWPEVWIQEIEWFPSRAKAEEAETAAIAVEGPRYNVLGNEGARTWPRRRSKDDPPRSHEEMIAMAEAMRRPPRTPKYKGPSSVSRQKAAERSTEEMLAMADAMRRQRRTTSKRQG